MSYDPQQYHDPYASPKSDPQWQKGVTQKQSGLGIASFVMAVLIGITAFALVVMAGVVEASTPGGMDEESPVAIIIGLGIFAVIGMSLLGIGLGIAGLLQPDRARIFSILGLSCNGDLRHLRLDGNSAGGGGVGAFVGLSDFIELQLRSRAAVQ